MRLYELAFAATVYSIITKDDSDFKELCNKTGNSFSFDNDEHIKALLTWLRKWGCRQIPSENNKENLKLAKSNIRNWYNKNMHLLPSKNEKLSELKEDDLNNIEKCYNKLKKVTMLKRENKNKNNKTDVGAGPVGASKILFFLRQNSLMPWDNAIKEKLKTKTYKKFLEKARDEIKELKEDVRKLKCELDEIPKELGQSSSTILKLVDEYYWVKYTKKGIAEKDELLANRILKQWYEWSLKKS